MRASGVVALAAVAVWLAGAPSAHAQQGALGYVKGQESLDQCNLNNPESIVAVARKYPNPEIRVMSHEELAEFERQAQAHNAVSDGRLMIEIAPPFGCNREKQIYIVFRARRTHDFTGQQAGTTEPPQQGTTLYGGVQGGQTTGGVRNICRDSPQSYSCRYGHADQPQETPQVTVHQSPGGVWHYGGATQNQAPRQQQPRPPRQVLWLCGDGFIWWRDGTKLGYSVCVNDAAVPISDRFSTPIIDATLSAADRQAFQAGKPTITRFRGYRTARGSFTTTDVWVRPRGAASPEALQFRVDNEVVPLTRQNVTVEAQN